MVSVKVRNVKAFKEAIDAISGLIEEGIFKFDSEGVTLRAMDPSQISMVYFSAPKSEFAEYDVSEQVNIGLTISDLSKVLGRAVLEKAENLTIENKDNLLELTLKSNDKSSKFMLPILDISQTVTGDPKVTESASVKLIAVSLKNALKNSELASTYVTFITKNDTFAIESKGDLSQYKVEYKKSSPDIAEIICRSESAKTTYPLQYLLDIMNGAPDSAATVIKYASNGVLKISYEIAFGSVQFYLAPIREE